VDENSDSSRIPLRSSYGGQGRTQRQTGIFDRIDVIYRILETEQEGQEGFHAETRRRGEGEKRERDFMELSTGLTR